MEINDIKELPVEYNNMIENICILSRSLPNDLIDINKLTIGIAGKYISAVSSTPNNPTYYIKSVFLDKSIKDPKIIEKLINSKTGSTTPMYMCDIIITENGDIVKNRVGRNILSESEKNLIQLPPHIVFSICSVLKMP